MNKAVSYINPVIRIVLCLLFAVSATGIRAQVMLKLTDALKLALESNYAIQLAKNDAEISKINNSAGAAGMYPLIAGTVSQDNQVTDTRQKFLNNTENNRTGAKANQLNAGVELSWTLFNGFKMFAAKNRLEQLQQMGELRLKMQIEQTFIRVIKAYSDIVVAQQTFNMLQQAVQISERRLQSGKDKYEAGKASKTEFLKAQVDLNTDKSALMRQAVTLKNLKLVFNQLLARELETEFSVEPRLMFSNNMSLADLQRKTVQQNSSLMLIQKNQQVNLLLTKEIVAERYPSLQLRSGYNYSNQESQAGFLQSSSNNGYHYGGGISLTLFNGFDINRRIKNAQLINRSADMAYKDSLSKVQSNLYQVFNTYSMALELINMEEQNLANARENFAIAEEQDKVGVITALELRDAQQSLLQNELRLVVAHYEAKLAETELLRLSGDLLLLN